VVGRTNFRSLLAPESRRRCFAKVNTGLLAEDRRGRNRTKVAAVARHQLAWIHEKDLILGDHSAAVPTKECRPPAVALARRAHRDSLDVTSGSSRQTDWPGRRKNPFEERSPAGEEPPCEEGCERLGGATTASAATAGVPIGRAR
jgi:hypothetical protein